MFDVQHGLRHRAKFPHPSALDLLIDRYVKTREQYLGVIINTTLEKMATGGVYDQLAEASTATQSTSAGSSRTSRR